jgi:hypothetical protein
MDGLWRGVVMNAQFQSLIGAGAIVPPDAFTKILLHFDGADGGTVFTDSAVIPNTFTASGNAQTHSTSFAAPKFGLSSGKFDGTGDMIQCPDSAGIRPGSGDWTLDFLVRFNAGGTNQTLFDKGYNANGGLLIQTDTALKLRVFGGPTQVAIESTSTPTGVWTHKAIVRSGNTFTIYSGGVSAGSGSLVGGLTLTSPLSIGAKQTDGSFSLNGNLDEYRWSVGIARWTANFTPPTAPY